MPDSLTSIGESEFEGCTGLTSVTIPNSVTGIANDAFRGCANLTAVYFMGNPPSAGSLAFAYEERIVGWGGFSPSYLTIYLNATVYYLPGTTGWDSTFGNLPTALWLPAILNGSSSLGASGGQNNQFGFTVSWAPNLSVIVDACADIAKPIWTPISTNTPLTGTFIFADHDSKNHPVRFYRVRGL
jgi:hypothetical protein